ncbi:hypothetical protein [Streptomyces sp. NPDC050560]|uniref:hypothetical protein n=1 Tax=Streptomyces sp. NPDC050560 TaxID=3365630 RepID=UPI0037A54867
MTDTRPAAAHAPRTRAAVGDPVKALLQRHRDLCAGAVDPLEIAAALEARGLTDRAAGRFRHRTVFSLAEELYARVSHDHPHPVAPAPPTAPLAGPGAHWPLRALAPGLVCALAVTALRAADGRAHLALAVAAPVAAALALRAAVRRGPLATRRPATTATRVWTCWLIAYAALGDAFLDAALGGGPDTTWPLAPAPVVGLAFAVLPAALCARLFDRLAARRIGGGRGLAEFASTVRPLLCCVCALFLAALAALLALAGSVYHAPRPLLGAGALGTLLMLARLLMAHGFTRAPGLMINAAGAAEVLALALVFAARLPGCHALDAPVERAVAAAGTAALPGAVCGAAALVLLGHAIRTLPRASAHTPRDPA